MLGSAPITAKALDDYAPLVGEERIGEIRDLARPLAGSRILHLNATAFGGGVAEILTTLVPLLSDAGLSADWQVMKGSDEFYQVTKAMHNSLQGMFMDWTPDMRELWLHYNRLNAQLFDEEYDFVVVHDPQPAGVLGMLRELRGRRPAGRWIWRCHLDLTQAQAQVWDFLRRHAEQYDAAAFTLEDYVKEDLDCPHVFTIPPAIDPLSAKNADLPADTVEAIRERYGQDPHRPFIVQVSRFDPWKDPLGVIEVYRAVKREIPELQLVLIASMAQDDPEGWAWYERTVRSAAYDFDILILSNLNGVGNVEVNAFQRSAAVVIQKSVREGFGLVVSEALWKGRPVVAGNVGGIPLQIINGKTGYLANTVEDVSQRVVELLRDPAKADAMGSAGREFVRDNFLITRYVKDYLLILRTLAGIDPAPQGGLARLTKADNT